MHEQQAETQALVVGLYSRTLPKSTPDIYQHMLKQHGCIPRYSARVLSAESHDGAAMEDSAPVTARLLPIGDGPFALNSQGLASVHYLRSPMHKVCALQQCAELSASFSTAQFSSPAMQQDQSNSQTESWTCFLHLFDCFRWTCCP